MAELVPDKEWWTAAEIAEARLVDMPGTKRNVNALAKSCNWNANPKLARRRQGSGGGWEYNWRLFPARARRQLLQAAAPKIDTTPRTDRSEAWEWFESLPARDQQVARERLRILQMVEAMVQGTVTKFLAVVYVSKSEGVAERTIWYWFEMVDGVRADDRLPFLAPRHKARPARRKSVHVDPRVMEALKGDYLRPAGPSFASCYRRVARIAARQGWTMPPERTLLRRFHDEVSEMTCVLMRKGVDALKTYFPSQTRDKTALAPMEAVNADFHKFDVFVEWPLEPGQKKPYVGRPQMVAFQDIHSGFILSWRVDQTPNRVAVSLAAGDMIEAYGIPDHVLMDNGREFAAKALTGGTPTRFRFKVRDTDPPGLFVALGCQIHWATPYSGQSKPIERAFRDMCDNIAKDPRFNGAYTGNRPDAKPEDYGSRAIPLETFLRVVSEGIYAHNHQADRRSEVAFGRSFADVFNEAYAKAPIRKATEAQRRLWLLGAEGVNAQAKTGQIAFQGNEYWDTWMNDIAGQPVIVRFDPSDFHAGLHVYSIENEYLGHAPCRNKAGFFDQEEARAHARARRDWLNREKAAADAHARLTAVELGRLLDEAAPTAAPAPEAKVVRPVFGGKASPRQTAPREETPREAAIHAAVVADLTARRPAPEADESPRQRFKRALDLEKAIEGGATVTDGQREWLRAYQNSPEYRGEMVLYRDFGDAMFG